jgi:hypothetical protein
MKDEHWSDMDDGISCLLVASLDVKYQELMFRPAGSDVVCAIAGMVKWLTLQVLFGSKI